MTRELEKFIIQFVFRLIPDNIEFVPSSEVNQRSICRGERGVRKRAQFSPEAEGRRRKRSQADFTTSKLVPIRARVHPFPFRTR